MKNKETKYIETIEASLKSLFNVSDEIALHNQEKVLNAFREFGLQPRHFSPSSGYGYDDQGRQAANKIFAHIFGCEAAIVSANISTATSALYHTLFGILRPHDTIYCISGTPYDTLKSVLFSSDKSDFSLQDMGVKYIQSDLISDNFDEQIILENVLKHKPKVIYIQRSRGYEFRESLSISKIKQIIVKIKQLKHNCCFVVDNCYGTFCEKYEPTNVGADIIVGSLIKNAGGGYANNGAYIAGRQIYIDMINNHINSPALGGEVGSYALGYKTILQGIFVAPSIVNNCKKIAMLFSKTFSDSGYQSLPNLKCEISDIVCTIKLEDKQKLIDFCKLIQKYSPVDSIVVPEPWAMPGYKNQVIMAGGSFVQGSTIELSCDGPIRPPYAVYLQGGLTYEHGKIALINLIKELNLLN